MASSSPIVSVIVPVYNTEQFVDEAIASIRAQSLQDIEIICVDDGSTDGSAAVVERHAEADSRIRLIRHERNLGVASARNTALSHGTGRFIYFFDSDDRLEPTALATLTDVAEHDDLDVVFFDVTPFFDADADNQRKTSYEAYYRRDHAYPGVVTGPALFTAMAMNDEWLPSPCTYLLRRSYLESIGLRFQDGVLHEDQYFTFALTARAQRVRHEPRSFFSRRVRSGSVMTSTPTWRHVAGLIESYGRAIALTDSLNATPESDFGIAVAREMGKTYEDAVMKFGLLDAEQREVQLSRVASTFAEREAVERMRLDAERRQQRNVLDAASLRIAALERTLPQRVVRRLRSTFLERSPMRAPALRRLTRVLARARRRGGRVLSRLIGRQRAVETYWWSGHPNFGDTLTPILLQHYGIVPKRVQPEDSILVGVGSLLEHLPKDYTGIVWGTGMFGSDAKYPPAARYLGVRGHLTRERVGAPADIALGDPGLLAERIVAPQPKRYRLGVVPHYVHKEHETLVRLGTSAPDVTIIDVTQPAQDVIAQISACDAIMSTSLHGLITADSFGIPATWGVPEPVIVGGDFKFLDHESVMNPAHDRRIDITHDLTIDDVLARCERADANAVRQAKEQIEASAQQLKRLLRWR